jgi:SulP family sulfate permease
MMERIDIIPDFIPEEQIFDKFSDCMTWVNEHVKDHTVV